MRVLLLEDSEGDAELIRRELVKLGDHIETLHVADAPSFARELAQFAPDVVLSDHSVPGVGGLAALELAQQVAPHAPFILVTGSLDEESAVEYMKAGAADYVLKDRLLRLPSAVRAALNWRRDREDKAKAEQQYHTMFTAAPLAIYRATLDGTILTANPAFARLLGYDDPADLEGRYTTRDVFDSPAERERLLEGLRATGSQADLEVRWRRRDGIPIWVQLTVNGATDTAGALRYIEGFARDITAQKELERQLQQSQKMEAIGQLAGGIAHDFNNLLTAIIGFSDLLLESLPDGGEQRRDVMEIRDASERAAALTRQLLAFSRKQRLEPKLVDVNVLVTNFERMLRRLIGEHIELRLALSEAPGVVRADPSQLEQVIMNLAVNARDAMPRGGTLTLETAIIELDAEYAAAHVGTTPGSYVMLAVSDTGLGMDEATKARVFEPFFTTKGPHKGTGLGLSTVYGIVKQSGGSVWLYSEQGRGTTFKVYLPKLAEGVAPDIAATGVAVADPHGTETILLVEDAEPVRHLARRALEARGYTVFEAKTGAEGLVASELHRGPLHLLLTDVVLPDRSGRELAEHLVVKRPGLRVLYMSGYTDDSVVHHGVLPRGAAYLQKPFTPAGLARMIRELLDRTG